MASYLFKNAHIIDPVTGKDTQRDIIVIDGIIQEIDENLSPGNAEVLDLQGRIAAPGFCDMHVHFREPGYEHKETVATGALSAAAGGFTAVACMPNTNPPIDSAEVIGALKQKSEHFPVDVHFIAAVSMGRKGKELSPMAELYKSGAVAFSDDGSPVYNSKLMRRAFEYSSMFDVPIIQHAEDLDLCDNGVVNEGYISTLTGLPGVPPIAETVMIQRDVTIAEYLDCQYHVAHISTAGATAIVRQARERGLRVTSEVTPHHISLTDEAVQGFDTNTKVNPPLRTMDDVIALKEALRDGVIDAIATDHAPHAEFEKEVEYVDAPFGIIGLESAIGVAVTELVAKDYLSLPELIEKFSVNPRRILRLPEIRIEEGQAANLTFFDPERVWEVDAGQFKSSSRNCPFHGMALTGKSLGIFNNNQIVWVG